MRPRGEQQSGFSFWVLRPMPNALPVSVNFPNAVKGDSMAPALRIYKLERLRVVFGKSYFPKRDDHNPALHAVKIAHLEGPAAKFVVPADAVQQFVNGDHPKTP